MSTQLRAGPWVPNIGYFDTIAALQAAYAGASQYPGTTAFCADSGMVYSDGASWHPFNCPPVGAITLLTSGASATVGNGVQTVILDGVNTTFALTFPAPYGDGQLLEVQAAQAVSVAFSTVATAPATTIKTTPSTLAAGVGVAWIYRVSNTTWYRLY